MKNNTLTYRVGELEKKVDSAREEMNLEIKDVLVRHENDITELKSTVVKNKK